MKNLQRSQNRDAPGSDRGKMLPITLSLTVSVCLLTALAGSMSARYPQSGDAGSSPDWVVATINGDPRSNMGFNWRSAGSGQRVQLAAGRCETDACFETSGLSFDAEIGDEYRKAKAIGLQPDTEYSYRVGASGNWSEVGTFTTAPAGGSSFSFLYTTDPQSATEEYSQLSGRTAAAAYKHFQDNGKRLSFWVVTGDHTENNRLEQWEWYFKYQKDVFRKVPYVPIVGNHDIPGDYGTEFFWGHAFNTETTSFNSMRGGVSRRGINYSFVYGGVLFFALDLEGNVGNSNIPAGYVDSLRQWMEGVIAEHSGVKWRVAFSHRGVRSGGVHPEVGGEIAKLYGDLEIDIGLHGHSHTYELLGPVSKADGAALLSPIDDHVAGRVPVAASVSRTGFKGGTYRVDKGTMYFLGNRSGHKGNYGYRGSPLETGMVSNYSPNDPSYTVVDVAAGSITFTTYSVDGSGRGTELDKFTIIKDVRERQDDVYAVDPVLGAYRTINLAGAMGLEFTVGPNPAAKSTGSVGFFVGANGKRVYGGEVDLPVLGALTVYDVTGNVVRKIDVNSERAVAHGRPFATWDLRNNGGGLVASGAYLVKGGVVINGKREKVSVVVAVR